MRRAVLATGMLAAAGALAAPGLAATPGINGLIAFERLTGSGAIYSMPGGGGTQTPLSTSQDSDAAWSPDGTRIAFTSAREDAAGDIYLMNADGTGVVRWTRTLGIDHHPAWSPDGSRIAWSSDRAGGNTEIWSARIDESDPRRHTSNTAITDDQPEWSPDSTAIAFRSGRDGGGGGGYLWRLSASGTEVDVRQLTTQPSNSPTWSPDGQRIAFDSTRGGNRDIYSASSGGGEAGLDRHTSDLAEDREPAWSPDGKRFAFSSGRGGGATHILTMSAVGTEAEVVPLTSTVNNDANPSWQTVAALPFLSAITPAAATAGSAPITLTVNGSGFTMRSRVRWQGQDRVTTFVSSTRLTAAIPASDLAGAGTAQVTVATGPTGGGTSGTLPFTVQAQAPPPPTSLLLTRALFEKKWAVSRLKGRLLLAGTVARPATLRVRVLRPGGRGKALVSRTFKVTAAGAFSRRLLLPPTLTPGRYLVRATEVGSGPGLLPAADRRSLLAAPREGVVSKAFFSTKINGRSFTRITGRSIIFAHFRFAARAKPGKKITVRWFSPGSRGPVAIDRKPAGSVVIAFIKSTGPLPRGAWRAELRYGRKLVSTARVVLR